jgi:glycosyltransferase involved in cell wall biosynthesis
MSLLLSIIIPAYNEEQRIAPSLDHILGFLSSNSYRAEVVIVNDGSTDNTEGYVLSRADEFRGAGIPLRVLTNEPNRGKGYSVRRGVSEARGEVILFTDADLSSPISEAPKLLDPIFAEQADVVFGSRALNREMIGIHQPAMREFGGKVFNFFMQMITGLRFKDTQCGFKAFRREVARPVFAMQRIERFGFDPEVLYIARKRRARLLEVAVIWNHAEGGELQGKLNYMRDSLNMFTDLLRIRLNDVRGRYSLVARGGAIASAERRAGAEEP